MIIWLTITTKKSPFSNGLGTVATDEAPDFIISTSNSKKICAEYNPTAHMHMSEHSGVPWHSPPGHILLKMKQNYLEPTATITDHTMYYCFF